MKSRLLLAALLFAAIPFSSNAQTDSSAAVLKTTTSHVEEIPRYRMNFIKTNLSSILLKNYSLQYERILKKKMSVAISFRAMPQTGIPFKSTILSLMDDDDPDTKDMIEKFRISNFAITPEIRFYLSKKGYGQGFYIALFYRYAQYTSNNLPVDYSYDDGSDGTTDLTGKLTTNTGGFMLGVQTMLGKNVCLDSWILGPHIGGCNGDFTGTPDKPLSANEQDDLRKSMEDTDIPFVNIKADVNANSAKMNLTGPWAGLRIGLSLGIRF
jgi:hypothetical protein